MKIDPILQFLPPQIQLEMGGNYLRLEIKKVLEEKHRKTALDMDLGGFLKKLQFKAYNKKQNKQVGTVSD